MFRILSQIGSYTLFLGKLFSKPEKQSMYWKETFRQMNDIGVGSLTIIAIISVFIGAVTSVQFSYQLKDSFIPLYYVGYIVRDSMIIEMAPTFSCLILAGKVGSNMASELGSMRISEQIDALDIMGVNTVGYLVGPKIIAAMFIVPFLVIISAFLGSVGGALAAMADGVSFATYERGLMSWFDIFNVQLMLIKSLVFSFIFTTISCWLGYNVRGGALEIGAASTSAVVLSSIFILVSDYLLAEILL